LGRIVFPHFPGHWLRLQGNSSATYTAFHQDLYGFCRFFRIDYPTLKRLAAEGLIETCKPATAPKKRRQEYALTDAGRICLREWLALPFQNDPPRNEFLLKLFFGREAAPGVALAHVRELQERNRRMLATLEGIEKMARANQSQDPNMPYWMLTLGLGLALTRAALDWGESALAELASMEAAQALNG
jgi:DNA-binding PadR family transcriptional regulator